MDKLVWREGERRLLSDHGGCSSTIFNVDNQRRQPTSQVDAKPAIGVVRTSLEFSSAEQQLDDNRSVVDRSVVDRRSGSRPLAYNDNVNANGWLIPVIG